jgi:hypothetical protein
LVVRKSTVASDVWMLAASCWTLHNIDVPFALTRTKNGDHHKSSYRFKPLTWNGSEPKEFRRFIEKCYVQEVHNRPSIDDIVNELHKLWVSSMKTETLPMKRGGNCR